MTIRAYYVEDAALAQLDVAMRLYFGGEEKDLLSVITLAGAAEEVFGKLLKARKNLEPSLETIKKAVVEMHQHISLDGEPITPREVADRANRARNRLKHWSADEGDMLKLDPAEEARDMLNRAMDNYWMLEQKLTSAMERFYRETHGRRGG